MFTSVVKLCIVCSTVVIKCRYVKHYTICEMRKTGQGLRRLSAIVQVSLFCTDNTIITFWFELMCVNLIENLFFTDNISTTVQNT